MLCSSCSTLKLTWHGCRGLIPSCSFSPPTLPRVLASTFLSSLHAHTFFSRFLSHLVISRILMISVTYRLTSTSEVLALTFFWAPVLRLFPFMYLTFSSERTKPSCTVFTITTFQIFLLMSPLFSLNIPTPPYLLWNLGSSLTPCSALPSMCTFQILSLCLHLLSYLVSLS